ncbi:DUF3025 domain-containing protein [Stenotrophomonas sp. Iso1]|uniref:DUF3025 domain-containing protein n=1 Tax=Stenotrophomonas sp. Iso1 TaxID=2977283 RepID=UPI0022B793F1|nr:DUF3025 domain-containing protein [Stenotrophomonas sp. Iso1]
MTESASESGAGTARRRFIAPPREQVDAACFQHPLFAEFSAWYTLMASDAWPDIDVLNARMPLPGRCFVTQDAALLEDGLHYESRILQGRIATRLQNWHDLFNAMVWARHSAIKHALNAQQCTHIARMGQSARNAGQQALTQFDETGLIVRVRDATLLDAWDAHDWSALMHANAARWRSGDIAIAGVIGHALMEQMLVPGRLLVGKCLVVQGEDEAACITRVAEAILEGEVLAAPAELRPLPLAGIPGWHSQQDTHFYAQADYFRPLREGRVYPRPLR